MQYLNYTWGNWLTVLLALAALYFLLRFLERWLGKLELLGPYQNKVREFIHAVLLVFEPVALLVLGVVFILIVLVYKQFSSRDRCEASYSIY